MSPEISRGELWSQYRRFLVPQSTEKIVLYPIHFEDTGEKRLVTINFGLGARPVGGENLNLSIVEVVGGGKSEFYRKVLEIDKYNIEEGRKIKNADSWLTAFDEAENESSFLFTLTFGEFDNDEQPVTFMHVRRGIRPEEALFYFNNHSFLKLFGGTLNIPNLA